MRIESSFEVPADRDAAWTLLMDVPRVVPCMPGATLVEAIDDSTWKANMSVKLGPIGLTFSSDVRREVADEDAGRVVLAIDARETRGRGSARATIESSLAAANGAPPSPWSPISLFRARSRSTDGGSSRTSRSSW